MGWLTMAFAAMGGHASAKAYLNDQFTYRREQGDSTSGLRVLASSCPLNRTYYAAVQEVTDDVGGDVFAVVCKVIWSPNSRTGEQFGYKDMTEAMGPCEDHCPRHILDLLTPTDREHAIDWRRRCRANLERRARRVEDGDRVRFTAALTFADGHVGRDFVVEKRGRRLSFRDAAGGGRYAIRNFRDLPWEIVPTTKVHRTIFA